MAYLQNGVCYADVVLAKRDFVSRISDVAARSDAVAALNQMTDRQLAVFFPDCMTSVQFFNQFFKEMLAFTVILIVFSYVKRAAFL
jgi:hypothetical protein